ncbi:hypothetical protein [Qaidamihabitans albus]|uniref:hypothetical protein n=1 Tax=Qaidamihabitans albus TaxID=2795733 RepID=UPI0018F2187A|nr:hypothetical protein [Qaidamihabitans albus]
MSDNREARLTIADRVRVPRRTPGGDVSDVSDNREARLTIADRVRVPRRTRGAM